jgi:hypothetical protein
MKADLAIIAPSIHIAKYLAKIWDIGLYHHPYRKDRPNALIVSDVETI